MIISSASCKYSRNLITIDKTFEKQLRHGQSKQIIEVEAEKTGKICCKMELEEFRGPRGGYNMRELSCIFTNAKETRIFSDDSEIVEIINAILHSDKTVYLDWDKEAGEDWIRFYRQESGLICMIHRRIGIAFVRLSNSGTLLTRCLRGIYIVEVESFSLDEWCIDLSYLYEYISEIHWNASPYAINTDRMSLSDLYYATV